MTNEKKTQLARSSMAALILTAATLGAPAAMAHESDTLVIARAMDVNSLDPARAFCDTCQFYLSAVYETLVTLDADNQSLKPNLAESWEINEDFTEYTFTLKEAHFADGSPVEAADVVWSLERLQNLQGSPSFLVDGLVSAEALDSRTVKFTLDAPNSEFINKLSAPYAGIVNADVAKAAGAIADETAATQDNAEQWFLTHSAGSGPFTLDAYSPETELRFARNDNYWGKEPAFSEVVVTQIADAVSQAQALETGQADIAMQIDPDTAQSIRSDDVVTKNIPSFNFVYFGFLPGADGMSEVLTKKVRQALALAVDYEGMLDFTVGGNGARLAAPIPNGFPGTDALTPRKHNIEKAKQMLSEAGVDDLTLTIGYPNLNAYGVDFNIVAQKLQQDFAAVGVTLDLKPLSWSVWWDGYANSEWPMTAVYYAPDYYGSGQYIDYFSMMDGSKWLGTASGGTPGLLRNDTEAQLYAQALASSGEKAAQAYSRLGEQMMEEAVVVPLVSPDLVLAYREDIEGVRYSACCNLPIAEISRN